MLDTKSLLNDVLDEAKKLGEDGKNLASRKLGGVSEGPEKAALSRGLGLGALGGAALGLLLGTRSGRKLGGSAVKLGFLAAAGTLLYRVFQSRKAKTQADPEVTVNLPSPDRS
jgi:uncharacterized membrane protein YebE (DUF533 family)